MLKTRTLFGLICLLLLVMAFPAAAQDFGLTDEETGRWLEANAASVDSPQFTFDYSTTYTLKSADATADMAITGGGLFDFENELAQLTIDGTFTSDGETAIINAELRLIGETLYVRGNDPTTGADSGWFDVDLDDIVNLNLDPAVLGDLAAEEIGAELDEDALATAAFALLAIDPTAFISMSTAPAEAGEQFTVDVSLSDLVVAPGTAEFIVALAGAFGEEATPTPEEITEGTNLVSQLLADTSISFNQTVSGGFVSQAVLSMNSTIDPSILGEDAAPITTAFTLQVNLSGYNEPGSLSEPENSTEIPFTVLESALTEAGLISAAQPESDLVPESAPSGDMSIAPGQSGVYTIPEGGVIELSLETTGQVNITVRALEPALDPRLDVIDSTGTVIAENDDHSLTDTDLGFLDSAVEGVDIPGSATIRIAEFGGASGDVEVTVMGTVSGSADAPPSGEAVSTDLTCDTLANQLDGAEGTVYTGTCPAGCTTGSLWGTDVYTDDSRICTAAIHAGVVGEGGGEVTFVIEPGLDEYPSTEQNGITSSSWGGWSRSFSFTTGEATGTASTSSSSDFTFDAALPNQHSFPSGATFSYPDGLTSMEENNLLAMYMYPSSRAFIQVYDTTDLFGEMDMGIDFMKQTYGSNATTTWGADVGAEDFVDVEHNGRTLSILQFTGNQGGEPVEGVIGIAPYTSGGYGYIIAYALPTVPANFADEAISVLASLDK